MVNKTVEVDVDLDDFDIDDLVEELDLRGFNFLEQADDKDLIDELTKRDLYLPSFGDSNSLLDKIFHLRRQGKPFDRELDEYLYQMTGRVI